MQKSLRKEVRSPARRNPSQTSTFYSEAPDGAPTHMGTFAAKSGRYTMHSTNMPGDDSRITRP